MDCGPMTLPGVNILLSVFISALHLGLDFVFISSMGIGGAAYALMIAYAVSGICSAVYLLYKCRHSWKGAAPLRTF